MKFTPLFDNILVERVERKSVSGGGILIPDSAYAPTNEATVVAVSGSSSKDQWRPAVSWGSVQDIIPVGTRVVIKDNVGTEVKDTDGKTYLLIKETDILGYMS